MEIRASALWPNPSGNDGDGWRRRQLPPPQTQSKSGLREVGCQTRKDRGPHVGGQTAAAPSQLSEPWMSGLRSRDSWAHLPHMRESDKRCPGCGFLRTRQRCDIRVVWVPTSSLHGRRCGLHKTRQTSFLEALRGCRPQRFAQRSHAAGHAVPSGPPFSTSSQA